MQSNELYDAVNLFPSLKPYFQGIYSISNLPKYLKINHFIIVNTDPLSLPGKHWFCLIKRKVFIEYFDSLGVSSEKLENLRTNLYLKKSIQIKYNETAVQSSDSISCGKFVLYFLVHRLHNLDLSFITVINDIFSDSIENNEKEVEIFYNEHFNSL